MHIPFPHPLRSLLCPFLPSPTSSRSWWFRIPASAFSLERLSSSFNNLPAFSLRRSPFGVPPSAFPLWRSPFGAPTLETRPKLKGLGTRPESKVQGEMKSSKLRAGPKLQKFETKTSLSSSTWSRWSLRSTCRIISRKYDQVTNPILSLVSDYFLIDFCRDFLKLSFYNFQCPFRYRNRYRSSLGTDPGPITTITAVHNLAVTGATTSAVLARQTTSFAGTCVNAWCVSW